MFHSGARLLVAHAGAAAIIMQAVAAHKPSCFRHRRRSAPASAWRSSQPRRRRLATRGALPATVRRQAHRRTTSLVPSLCVASDVCYLPSWRVVNPGPRFKLRTLGACRGPEVAFAVLGSVAIAACCCRDPRHRYEYCQDTMTRACTSGRHRGRGTGPAGLKLWTHVVCHLRLPTRVPAAAQQHAPPPGSREHCQKKLPLPSSCLLRVPRRARALSVVRGTGVRSPAPHLAAMLCGHSLRGFDGPCCQACLPHGQGGAVPSSFAAGACASPAATRACFVPSPAVRLRAAARAGQVFRVTMCLLISVPCARGAGARVWVATPSCGVLLLVLYKDGGIKATAWRRRHEFKIARSCHL